MFKHKANTVSESAVAGTVVGTCRIHPQTTYAIVDHDPAVLDVDAVTGEIFLITPDTVSEAVSAYGVGVQALVDGSIVSARSYSITNGHFANSVPVIDGLPQIVGVAKEGETLTVIPAPTTGVPAPTIVMQLQLDSADYGPPMTGTTFVPNAASIGGTFTVIQTATNSEGSDQATSAATATVVAGDVAPGITGVPTISGAAQEGQTLTATPATMTGSPPPTATYQWYDSLDAAISGATGLTYIPVTGDVGDQLYVKQTATNGIGSPATADSALTGVIAALTPYNASPVITSNGAGATAAINLAENITQVTTVTANYAYPVVYSITGGADAAKFSIDPVSGALAFLTPPDYDTPTDANTDNDYIVEVTAAAGPESDVQTITVTVDEATGGGLGPELWPIPTFASTTGLSSAGANWTVSSGQAVCNGEQSGLEVYNVIEAGKTYRFELTISSYTSGSCRWAWLATTSSFSLVSSVGTFTVDKVAQAGDLHFYLGSDEFVGTVTAYSCKEVL